MKVTNGHIVHSVNDIQAEAFLRNGWKEVVETKATSEPETEVTEAVTKKKASGKKSAK